MKRLNALLLAGTSVLSAPPPYPIMLSQSGDAAQEIYRNLEAKEEIEKEGSGHPRETRTFKVGENILCMKTQPRSAKKSASYFCSAGFSPRGVAASKGE